MGACGILNLLTTVCGRHRRVSWQRDREAIQLAALTEDGRRQEARDQEAAVERAEEAGEASQLRQQLDEAEAELEKARITAQEPSEVKIRVIGVNLTPDLPGDPPPGQRLLKEVSCDSRYITRRLDRCRGAGRLGPPA